MSFNAPPPPPEFQQNSSSNEQTMIVLAHLGGLILGFIPALVIMLTSGSTSARVRAQAVEALNFQITLVIAGIVAFILTFILIGILLFAAIFIVGLVFPILAAVKVSQGQDYFYPISLRLVK
ncbi:MAG: hypothetical protein RIS43_692 [Actinomycetota bacterium]|jgi:uncharacterized Tic20 family protein